MKRTKNELEIPKLKVHFHSGYSQSESYDYIHCVFCDSNLVEIYPEHSNPKTKCGICDICGMLYRTTKDQTFIRPWEANREFGRALTAFVREARELLP